MFLTGHLSYRAPEFEDRVADLPCVTYRKSGLNVSTGKEYVIVIRPGTVRDELESGIRMQLLSAGISPNRHFYTTHIFLWVGNKIAGQVILDHVGKDLVTIGSLFVFPYYRNQGLGRRLIDYALHHLAYRFNYVYAAMPASFLPKAPGGLLDYIGFSPLPASFKGLTDTKRAYKFSAPLEPFRNKLQ
jgi:GNAT superfamily N-acetyltransferase